MKRKRKAKAKAKQLTAKKEETKHLMKMKIALLLSILISSPSSAYSFGGFAFFGGGKTSSSNTKLENDRNELKLAILELSTETERGLIATSEQQDKLLQLFEQLETLNPTDKPLQSDLVNGKWLLRYTTSDSILGRNSMFPKVGPIFQTIDTTRLYAENSEVVSYYGLKVPQRVSAELYPQNDQLTKVQFKRFYIGPITFNAPESFKGALDVTYVDDELRLSRGDKGNIFVLTREDGDEDDDVSA